MEDIANDFQRLAGNYSFVRICGTDCNQVAKVYAIAKSYGMKLFCGIWDPASVQNEANTIIAAVQGDWSMVHTVSVGNELINNGKASPQQIVSAVRTARSILRAAGYKGPVVTVDTFVAAKTHPEMYENSDYCAINAHAFFDKTVSAFQAGMWLQATVSSVRSALSTPMDVVVTATGWPTRGDSNGAAVPSLEQQKAALDSIKAEFASSLDKVVLFSAFNNRWQPLTAATFNAEPYWGIGGAVALSDA
jgi:exo-beta-1,3-glucanase (GH17 family)